MMVTRAQAPVDKFASLAMIFCFKTTWPYNLIQDILIESPLFSKLWPGYWPKDECGVFSAWLAANPNAGNAVCGSGSIRKVRQG